MTLPRLALLSTTLVASLLASNGCGDGGGADPDAGVNVDSGDTHDGATFDAPVGADAAEYDGGTSECLGLGGTCSAASQCCSDLCEQDSLGDLVCQPGGSCKGDTEICATAAQCCSLYCDDGLCATGAICEPQGGSCDANTDCCGNDCDLGDSLLCLGTDASCQAVGDSCNTPGNCCSGRCEEVATDDLRCLPIGPCGSAGEVCADGGDCCSGICDEDGLCPFLGACTTVFEPCEGGGECCSGICADPGTGYMVCLYVGGCTPMKELCTTSTECCSGECIADDGGLSMRCKDPPGCLNDGEICGYAASNNCCSGNTNCLPTSIGVSRCLFSDTECIPVTGECSSSDECCDGVCAPAPVTGILVCNPDCIPNGQACTTDADCCDMACNNHICGPPDDPCIPLGAGPCTDSAECCDGECGANPADPDGDWICRYVID